MGIMTLRSVPAPAAQDRLELRGERARGGEERAQAVRRRGTAGSCRRRSRAAGPRRACPRAGRGSGPSRARCSVAGRPAARAGERDLGAEQADAGRAVGEAEPGLRRGRDVAQHGDRLAVGGDAPARGRFRAEALPAVIGGTGARRAPATRARSAGAGSTVSSPAAASRMAGVRRPGRSAPPGRRLPASAGRDRGR